MTGPRQQKAETISERQPVSESQSLENNNKVKRGQLLPAISVNFSTNICTYTRTQHPPYTHTHTHTRYSDCTTIGTNHVPTHVLQMEYSQMQVEHAPVVIQLPTFIVPQLKGGENYRNMKQTLPGHLKYIQYIK